MSNAFNVAPGLYVREYDLSQRVKQVSTSIGAIVGESSKGPVNERILVTSKQEFIDIFGKPNPGVSKMHYAALQFLSEANRLYVVRTINDDTDKCPLTATALYTIDDVTANKPRGVLKVLDDGTLNPKGLFDPFNTYVFNPNDPAIERVTFMVCAENPGDWNNRLYVRIRPSYKSGLSEFNQTFDDPATFYLEVFDEYRSPTQMPDESFYVKLVPSVDGFGNQLFIEDVVNNRSSRIRIRMNPYAKATIGTYFEVGCFMDGGTNGQHVSSGQMRRAWSLFSDPEKVDVNILIQGGVPLAMTNFQDIADIQREMVKIAESRMDAIALLDIPSDEQSVSDAVAYRRQQLNIDSSYGAIYTPDVLVYDEYNDLSIFIPPSGFAAAACAITDRDFNVFTAPAGMLRGTLRCKGAKYVYNQGKRDALNDANINAIRYFTDGSGYKIWGADTLQSIASALSYIPVRRLLNYIEKSLAITHLYSVFNPNNQILRSRVVAITEAFLTPIQNEGGLYWYGVQCDDSNNPPSSIANGDCNLSIAFDPVIMTKRINLQVNIVPTGANFKEFLSER